MNRDIPLPTSDQAEGTGPRPGGAEAAPDPWRRRRTLVLLAAWLGLVLGFVDSGTLAVLYAWNRAPLVNAAFAAWMAPASLAAILALISLPVCLVMFLFRWRMSARRLPILVWICGFPAFLLLIHTVSSLLLARLYLWALAILAAGLTFKAAQAAGRRPLGFYRLVRGSTVALLLVDALLAVIALASPAWRERQALAQLPVARPGAPNVLLLVLDTVRAKSMSLYGYPGKTTPNLERWAQRGVVFEQAVATASWTAPSHASMFTGRDAHQLSIDWNARLDGRDRTLAEVLAAQGYLTAGFVSNVPSAGRHTGLDRGFAHYDSNRATPMDLLSSNPLGRMLSPVGLVLDADQINARFLEWLAPASRQRPFFAFLNYLDCHEPYKAPRGGRPFAHPERPYNFAERRVLQQMFFTALTTRDLPEANLALAEDAYNGCLLDLDRAVNELLWELDRRGELDNTLVVVVADHGEQFGEHGLFGHGNSLYRPVLHVPLMIFGPGHLAAGKREPRMVSLRDLPATILELVDSDRGDLAGDSFADCVRAEGRRAAPSDKPPLAYLSQGTHFPEWFPNGPGPVKAVFRDGYEFIVDEQQQHLYNFQTDPQERNDLIRSPALGPERDACQRLVPTRGAAPP